MSAELRAADHNVLGRALPPTRSPRDFSEKRCNCPWIVPCPITGLCVRYLGCSATAPRPAPTKGSGGSPLGREKPGLLLLHCVERAAGVLSKSWTWMRYDRDVLCVIARLPFRYDHVVPRHVRAELKEHLRHVFVYKKMFTISS
jgi:hypothetical protein